MDSRKVAGLAVLVALATTAIAVATAFQNAELQRKVAAVPPPAPKPPTAAELEMRKLGVEYYAEAVERDGGTASPTDPCPAEWNTPFGTFFTQAKAGEDLGWVVREQLQHVYEKDEVKVREGDVVFDVGAHLGVFARYALLQKAAKVVAMEPETTNVACIRKSFQKEIAEGRLVLVDQAAWDAKGTLRFHQGKDGNSLQFHVEGVESGSEGAFVGEFPATTIDLLSEELKLPRVDFIKMDIEGSEPEALRGASKVIARDAPRLAIAIYHVPPKGRVPEWVTVPQFVLGLRPTYQVTLGKEFEAGLFYDPTLPRP